MNDFDHFCGNVLFHVVGHGDAVVAVSVHFHGGIDRLKQTFLVNTGKDKASLVQRLGALGGSSDANSRERLFDAREETAFLGERPTVGHHAKGVHLQAVVIMEPERLMLNHAPIKSESALFEALAASRMAGIEDGQIVFSRHPVDRGKQTDKVLFGVNVLLAVCGKQDVFSFFQPQPPMDVARLDLGKIVPQDFRHWTARHISPLFRQPTVGKITAGVLGIRHVDVADDVHDAAVGLFRQTFVLAAVPRFHVENRNMQTLRTDDRQTGIGVAQHENRVRLDLNHKFVGLGDDVAAGLTQIGADGVKIDVGIGEFQILEEHAVEVVVIVLTRVRKDRVKVRAALSNDRREPDDLRPCADDDEQFQFAVVLPLDLFKHLIFLPLRGDP